MKKVYAFDFDGTLTKRDTLIEIIRFARGDRELLLCLLRFLPLLVLMRLHLYPNGRAKQRVFAHCFGGMKSADFDALCRRFAAEKRSLLRARGVEKMREVLAEGSRVVVVTASIEQWVRPFFEQEGVEVTVVGTQIEVKDGIVTGQFATPNCHGKQKVVRLQQLLPARTDYVLIAYGDSHGDAQLLDYANEAYYKPFRK